jgi:menaquinone-dependent protoporphyrinogen oxidase
MANDVLIVYATMHGQAELVARRVSGAASGSGLGVTLRNVNDVKRPDLEAHPIAVLVASVHFGRHQRSMSRFVRRNRERLGQVRSAFISVSGDAAAAATLPRAEGYVQEFTRATGWTPDQYLLAGGAVKLTAYNFLFRWMALRSFREKGIELDPHRDYEYTDWEAVHRFARTFFLEAATAVA